MADHSPALDKAWDDVFLLEDQAIERGRQEGLEKAHLQRFQECSRLGWQKGQEIGEEIGFYRGFALAWIITCSSNPSAKRVKAHNVLVKLLELAESFPLDNVKTDNAGEQLMSLRGKFKHACTLLSLKAEMPGGSNLQW